MIYTVPGVFLSFQKWNYLLNISYLPGDWPGKESVCKESKGRDEMSYFHWGYRILIFQGIGLYIVWDHCTRGTISRSSYSHTLADLHTGKETPILSGQKLRKNSRLEWQILICSYTYLMAIYELQKLFNAEWWREKFHWLYQESNSSGSVRSQLFCTVAINCSS
jgi:hypothetical protein